MHNLLTQRLPVCGIILFYSFMKLRLDTVYKGQFDAKMEDALASTTTSTDGLSWENTPPHSTKPEPYRAPYSQYQQGWWKIFLPANN